MLIGFIGVGAMGGGLARNLIRAAAGPPAGNHVGRRRSAG